MSRWAFVLPVHRPGAGSEERSDPLVVLAEALMSLSSQVSLAVDGVWLEVSRSVSLFGGEEMLAERALGIARRCGLEVALVIADRPETARIVARSLSRFRATGAVGPPVRSPARGDNAKQDNFPPSSPSGAGTDYLLIAPGRDAETLAPLPLVMLGASPKALEYLSRLGIRTVGALAPLSPDALRRRLGFEGARLVKLARAAPSVMPERYRPPDLPTARRELEPPLPPSEAVLFLIKGMLDELLLRLSGRGLALAELRLVLAFEGGEESVEELLFPRPLRSSALIVAILRERLFHPRGKAALQLEGDVDWPARLVSIVADVLRTAAAPQAQLSLQSREEVDTEELATLLARLAATLGGEREEVFAAELVSTHQPEASWRRRDFPLATTSSETMARERDSIRLLERVPKKHEHEHREPPSPRPVLVLPTPLPLEGAALTPGASLRWDGGGGRIRHVWGPERLRGQWWGRREEMLDREYYVVDLHDGARIWVCRDLPTESLLLQGIFD